jgi:hypothetical protein
MKKLTATQVGALRALAAHDAGLRYSNSTDLDAGHLHWSPADALIDAGLATRQRTGAVPTEWPVVITDAGRAHLTGHEGARHA